MPSPEPIRMNTAIALIQCHSRVTTAWRLIGGVGVASAGESMNGNISARFPTGQPGVYSTIVEAAPAHSPRSEEHTSELQSLMRISYAVFCLKKNTLHHKHTKLISTPKKQKQQINTNNEHTDY